MRRFMRVTGIVGLVIGALALVAYGVLHMGSQRILNRTYDVPLTAFSAPDAAARLVGNERVIEGERLARIGGCIGCHGMEMEGRVFFDEPWLGRVVAPDLTRIAEEYSDAELERVIRQGVRRDGRGAWAMPSPMFAHLSDEHLGAVISYIRSVPPRNGLATEVRLRLLGRIAVFTGELPPLMDEMPPTPPVRPVPDPGDPMALGRYLAMTACSECHGPDLRGGAERGTPPLAMAIAYSPEAFSRLMREGIALGDRELGMMGSVSRSRFSHFTEAEVEALHTYLGSLAGETN